MSLSFLKNKAASAGKAAPSQAAEQAEENQPAAKSPNTTKPSTFNKKAATGGVSFLKTGSEAKEAMVHEEAKAEAYKAEAGKMWRFYLKDGEERKVTFLDGTLDEDGMLDDTRFYQHMVQHNGSWTNYVCTADVDKTQPCPICERGNDFRPSLVGVLTVIDHTPHTIKNGPKAGQIIKDQRKLYVAKKGTIQHLAKLAGKRGGTLAGCTFDISRTGDKEPGVGNQFDFVEQHGSIEELMEAFGISAEDCQPANYMDEITYYSPQELIDLGVGKALGGTGYEKGVQSSGTKKDYGKHL